MRKRERERKRVDFYSKKAKCFFICLHKREAISGVRRLLY